jgi:hypothetical protein
MKTLALAVLLGAAAALPASAASAATAAPAPDLRGLLTATRLRAKAVREMKELPPGPGAFAAASADLDRIAALEKKDDAAAGATPPSRAGLMAALALARLTVKNPASTEDLAFALQRVADAGDRFLAETGRVPLPGARPVPLPRARPAPLPRPRPADVKAEKARRKVLAARAAELRAAFDQSPR